MDKIYKKYLLIEEDSRIEFMDDPTAWRADLTPFKHPQKSSRYILYILLFITYQITNYYTS